ncbi:MAG: peptidoglycan D,D-transpeptidase FtsI family protein [Candidatus Cryptobacteroides sp.]
MAINNEIKKESRKRDKIGMTLYILYLLFLFMAIVIVVRIAHIQLFYKPDNSLSKYLRPKSIKENIEPTRGAIIAHDGRLLAMSTPMYQIYMDCTVLKAKNNKSEETKWRSKARELAKGLSQIYKDKSGAEYYKIIITGRERGSRYVKIGKPIDHEILQSIKRLPLFNEGQYKGGIIIQKNDTRQYPYGALARRTIGYVKDNNKSNGNNKIGLEGRFDYILHGKEGYKWMKIADNKAIIPNTDSAFVKAEDGKDLRTTLNIDIQDIADDALRANIADNPKIEGGCVIVMDVSTGAIRAMVNLLRDSTTNKLNESYNLAIGRVGEPGSVFKATTLMSLLEDGKVRLSDQIPTNHGDLKGFNRDQHIVDYERINKTDKMTVLHGFEISSNYIFRKLAIDNYGNRPKKMLDKLYLYKLGEAYDFDLAGFKSPTIPSPDSRNWSGTDLGSIAIGYSVTVTPLHTLTFYNAIANKGKMMKPYIVEDIEENGIVREKRGPSVLNGSICSKATADTLTRALKRVAEEGTGRRMLKGAICPIAGKTGTSRIVLDPKYTRISKNPYEDEKGRKQYQATFVGFYPADRPQYSVIVVIYSYLNREIFYGGTLPAMTFREIVDKTIALNPLNGEAIRKTGSRY